jgi:DivIVA domain-containing protein
MIDLTPLDVRKKKGDLRRGLRGYETGPVDDFLDLVAERMEELVRENAQLRERAAQMTEAVGAYREREKALNEALVSAQQLREEARAQAAREAELVLREARAEAERIVEGARRQVGSAAEAAKRIHGHRVRFVRNFRAFVERQLAEIEMEEERLREASRPEGEPPGPAERRPAGGAAPSPEGSGE